MLLNHLYTISDFRFDDMELQGTINLDASHEIFKGHFPSQPVLPGVCLIEMLKDLINKAMERPYLLSSASNVKYLKVVDPEKNQLLTFTIKLTSQENGLKVLASSTMEDGSVNFKFKGIFVA